MLKPISSYDWLNMLLDLKVVKGDPKLLISLFIFLGVVFVFTPWRVTA
jgi:hypothetical protein